MLSRSDWRGTIPAGYQQEKIEGRQIVMISTLELWLVPSIYLFSKLIWFIVSSWHVYLASLLCSGCWFGNSHFTTVTTTDHHFYISISILLHCPPLLSLEDLSVNANVQDLVNQNKDKKIKGNRQLLFPTSHSVNCLIYLLTARQSI